MKKILKIFFGLAVVIIIAVGYVQFKFISIEKAVIEYLTINKKVPEKNIVTDPFMANLSGEKNWMVAVTLKGDSKIYSYYLNNQNQLVLESIVEENGEGEVEILNKIIN